MAINFNADTRRKLQALCDGLRTVSSRGRYSLPENLHLTLAFLGECDDKQTAAIKSAMDDVIFDPFDMQIDRIGRFKRNNGDIWWAGVRENNPLLDMHQKLTAGLRANGLDIEERKYSPHITLGREIITIEKPHQIEPFGEKISKIDLMKSERINGKLTYTSIYRITNANMPLF